MTLGLSFIILGNILITIEALMTPEVFAHLLCRDFDCPIAPQFIPYIADTIRKQVLEYSIAVENDPLPSQDELDKLALTYGLVLPEVSDDEEEEEDEEGYGDLRIIVKVSFNVMF